MVADNFDDLDMKSLRAMRLAGEQIMECYRVLEKPKANIVGELLKGQPEFFEWDHYPKGDVYDNETHSQYYYHAHPPETRLAVYGAEHGHFHTFVRPKGMPKGIKPAKLPDYKKSKGDNDDLSHLIGISMDRRGFPIRAFSANRWLTGEVWYKARDVIRMMDVFFMDHAYPSWPVNIWITAMFRLFRPQFEQLLIDRDTVVAQWVKDHPGDNAFENRDLEIPSHVDISVEKQIKAVQQALSNKR
jgi:hypothetical protein